MSNKLSLALMIAALSCGSAHAQTETLKRTFGKDFLIGAAINSRQIDEKDSIAARLIPEQFSTLTPENVMKAEVIHPAWDRYDFAEADKLVAYASKHDLTVNAHTLVWHSQLPPYVRSIKNADSLRSWLTDHIQTIASRYDGKVYSWDVVNEALNEDGTIRKSIFSQLLGEDFFIEAFRLAQKAAPHTRLYYNDYNIEQPAKRAGAIALIKKIQKAGVRIDGVGIQGHWNTAALPLKAIEESIREFSSLGIEVMFTELDLSVLPNPRDHATADVGETAVYNTTLNPYAAGLPDSVQEKQTIAYTELFKLFLTYPNKVSRITFWGVDDRTSWLNNWPVPGRTNYPLLFDRRGQPKPSFYSVIKVKRLLPH